MVDSGEGESPPCGAEDGDRDGDWRTDEELFFSARKIRRRALAIVVSDWGVEGQSHF